MTTLVRGYKVFKVLLYEMYIYKAYIISCHDRLEYLIGAHSMYSGPYLGLCCVKDT